MNEPRVRVVTTIRDGTADFIDAARTKAIGVLQKASDMLRDTMSEPGSAPTYPIDWDSPKQRRYVMMMLRKSGEIPYRRKQKYENGYRSEHVVNGAVFGNTWDRAKFLAGLPDNPQVQSRIHRGRWNLLAEKLALTIDFIRDALEKEIKSVELVK